MMTLSIDIQAARAYFRFVRRGPRGRGPGLGGFFMLRRTRHLALLAATGLLVASALPAAAAHRPQQSKQEAQEQRSTTDQLIDTPVEVDAAHDDQHGADDGHLPGSRRNVKLLGRADICLLYTSPSPRD